MDHLASQCLPGGVLVAMTIVNQVVWPLSACQTGSVDVSLPAALHVQWLRLGHVGTGLNLRKWVEDLISCDHDRHSHLPPIPRKGMMVDGDAGGVVDDRRQRRRRGP
ncbi:hypothetical protein E3N88_12073 [Mikania micrantha]|uniref:Uncharacterized protein n=1 Tax=Mikania micrantha TaxID=192012 RepID=A0A5N6P4H2_9ASTR|nr:hypothetical protein E3N88_12073 [Mikania micrantha]